MYASRPWRCRHFARCVLDYRADCKIASLDFSPKDHPGHRIHRHWHCYYRGHRGDGDSRSRPLAICSSDADTTDCRNRAYANSSMAHYPANHPFHDAVSSHMFWIALGRVKAVQRHRLIADHPRCSVGLGRINTPGIHATLGTCDEESN